MSYLIQTLLNLVVFIVAGIVVNFAVLGILIRTELITVLMNADTLMWFKKIGKHAADYENAYVVKNVEGAGIYKRVDEYLKNMDEEDCEEVSEDLPEPEDDDPCPKEEVATEEVVKEDVTEEVKTE